MSTAVLLQTNEVLLKLHIGREGDDCIRVRRKEALGLQVLEDPSDTRVRLCTTIDQCHQECSFNSRIEVAIGAHFIHLMWKAQQRIVFVQDLH